MPTRHITEAEIVKLTSSTTFEEGGQGLIEAAFEEEIQETPAFEDFGASLVQLSEDITTLSLVPRSRWQTLLHLDVIKVGVMSRLLLKSAQSLLAATEQAKGAS